MVYEPREDSYLLLKHIKEYARGTVLDMGAGSGILAKEAAKTAKTIYAADIDTEAIQKDHDNIHFVQSDLFESIDKDSEFDLIIFNPPYLPDDPRVKDIALDGGKHGFELTGRFLDQANNYLKGDGKILLLFSSLTKIDKINDFIMRNCLKYTQIDSLKLDFEELYVYLIEKSDLLIDLESKSVHNVYYLAKGHRGVIFTGMLDGHKVTIKSQNPKSEAIGRIENEVRFLRVLNEHSIGPKLLFSGEHYFVYGFVEGAMIIDYIENNSRADIKRVLKNVLHQLHELDELGINKEEMHHPVKHILVSSEIVLIDFERARYSENPQNVTAFCQFLLHLKDILAAKEIIIEKDKIIELAKDYKASKDINIIINYLK